MNGLRKLCKVLAITLAVVVALWGLAIVAFIFLIASGMADFGSNK